MLLFSREELLKGVQIALSYLVTNQLIREYADSSNADSKTDR
jgi:hypothetical protein